MKTQEEYFNSAHRTGRIGIIGAIVVMFAIPTAVCLRFDIMPELKDVILASIPLLTIFLPITISEVLSYTPILGSSIYLTLITGNLMNLKIPAALNAIRVADVEDGTEESDLVSGLAIAVSSVITMVIIFLGVLLLTPLQPVLESEAVKTASLYVLPALFGCLGVGILSGSGTGGVKIKGKLLAAVIPALLMVVFFFVLGAKIVDGLTGVFILIMLPIIFFSSRWLYKKNIITVRLPGDEISEDVKEEVGV